MDSQKKYVSASTMKSLEQCSCKYYTDKHLKVPEKNNDGARRGTICHALLEYLQNEKHRANYDRVIKANDVSGDAACLRLTRRHFEVAGMDDKSEENFDLVKKMIMVGLKHDFFCTENGGKLGKAETDFLIENEDPPYIIKGYIDKHALYDKGKTLKIIDYKSSKKKFSKDALDGERQAMMYTLASKTLWPKVKRIIFNFLFLKFPKQPIQELEFSDEALKGFEHYISRVFHIVNNFTKEKHAVANFAADSDKNSWLCAAGRIQPNGKQKWVCPQRDPYKYYVLLDNESRIVDSSMKKSELKAEKGQKIEKREYEGCPRWHGEFATQASNDPFDL
jgi:hypothetical protein